MALLVQKHCNCIVLLMTLITLSIFNLAHCKKANYDNLDIKDNELSIQVKTRQYPPQFGVGAGGCPLCDSSVYSYCSHKLIHDTCCCNFPAYQKPQQCYYYDCSLLYAKSCYEHQLIMNCCCNSPY